MVIKVDLEFDGFGFADTLDAAGSGIEIQWSFRWYSTPSGCFWPSVDGGIRFRQASEVLFALPPVQFSCTFRVRVRVRMGIAEGLYPSVLPRL